MRSLRLLILGSSIKATKYSDPILVRSHFMSGNMRKPKGSDSGERKSIFSASERPAIISSILGQDAQFDSRHWHEQVKQTIACAKPGMHLCRTLRRGHIVRGFRARYGPVAWNTRNRLERLYIFE